MLNRFNGAHMILLPLAALQLQFAYGLPPDFSTCQYELVYLLAVVKPCVSLQDVGKGEVWPAPTSMSMLGLPEEKLMRKPRWAILSDALMRCLYTMALVF